VASNGVTGDLQTLYKYSCSGGICRDRCLLGAHDGITTENSASDQLGGDRGSEEKAENRQV
jgi:hypothetical protein